MNEELKDSEFDEPEISIEEEIGKLKAIIFKERTRLDKETISFIKRTTKGERVPKEEQDIHADAFKHLRTIEKSYYALVKMSKSDLKGSSRLSGGDGKMFSMQIVKDKPSSMGDIVRTGSGE